MHFELFVLAQSGKQVALVDAGPHALEDVEALRLGRDEPESVELRHEVHKFVLGWSRRRGTQRRLPEKVEVPAQNLHVSQVRSVEGQSCLTR